MYYASSLVSALPSFIQDFWASILNSIQESPFCSTAWLLSRGLSFRSKLAKIKIPILLLCFVSLQFEVSLQVFENYNCPTSLVNPLVFRPTAFKISPPFQATPLNNSTKCIQKARLTTSLKQGEGSFAWRFSCRHATKALQQDRRYEVATGPRLPTIRNKKLAR
jgi:hypothetical protein